MKPMLLCLEGQDSTEPGGAATTGCGQRAGPCCCPGVYPAGISGQAGRIQNIERVPVGLYDTPFCGSLILGLGSQSHKVGYPKKGVWYEPTGIEYRTGIPETLLLGPS